MYAIRSYYDTERQIIRCNPAMTEVFGFSADELLGKKTALFYARQDDFDAQGAQRFNPVAASQGQPYVVDYRRKDGTTFPGETLGTAVRSEQGEVLGYLA